MPDDINMHMLSFVTPSDLHDNVSRVSKNFYTLSNDPSGWKEIAIKLGVELAPDQSARAKVFSAKTEVFIKFIVTNRIFITAMDYLRQQVTNHPEMFPDFNIPKVPAGTNPLDIYSKILKVCSDSIQQIPGPDGETISMSPIQGLVDFFNDVDEAFLHYSKMSKVPAEIRDPQLMQIFAAAGVEIHEGLFNPVF